MRISRGGSPSPGGDAHLEGGRSAVGVRILRALGGGPPWRGAPWGSWVTEAALRGEQARSWHASWAFQEIGF